jgi:hypothetical protein
VLSSGHFSDRLGPRGIQAVACNVPGGYMMGM